MDWIESTGVVTPGYRVASAACTDPRFPGGTIAAQLPFIRAAIGDLETYFRGPAHPGTINVHFAGSTVELVAPEIFIPSIVWTSCFPPESFFLSRAELASAGGVHPVFLYIPDPATKPDHPAAAGSVELLAAFIPGIGYGDGVSLRYSPAALRLNPACAPRGFPAQASGRRRDEPQDLPVPRAGPSAEACSRSR